MAAWGDLMKSFSDPANMIGLIIALIIASVWIFERVTGAWLGRRVERLSELATKLPKGAGRERIEASAEAEAVRLATLTGLPRSLRAAFWFVGLAFLFWAVTGLFAANAENLGFFLGRRTAQYVTRFGLTRNQAVFSVIADTVINFFFWVAVVVIAYHLTMELWTERVVPLLTRLWGRWRSRRQRSLWRRRVGRRASQMRPTRQLAPHRHGGARQRVHPRPARPPARPRLRPARATRRTGP